MKHTAIIFMLFLLFSCSKINNASNEYVFHSVLRKIENDILVITDGSYPFPKGIRLVDFKTGNSLLDGYYSCSYGLFEEENILFKYIGNEITEEQKMNIIENRIGNTIGGGLAYFKVYYFDFNSKYIHTKGEIIEILLS